jgi:predicted dehydrogenase
VSPHRRTRLALLGCGWIAQNRLRQIAADGSVEVVALVDPAVEACVALREFAPDATIAVDPGALTREQVDGVMISTPTGLHAQQAVALLERGLPVFVQKPVGTSAAEVARVLDAAARSDVPLESDFCYRDLGGARALREALLAETVGRPFYVEACFHNAYRPSARWSNQLPLAGGGALMDLGIHLIDLVLWLTGRGADLRGTQLRRRGRPLAPGDVEDFARLALRLEDGADVQVVTSWDASTGQDAQIRLTVYGEHGALVLANRAGSFFHFDAWCCRGTQVEALAADDSDDWQAEPLRRWLKRVSERAGYREPDGIRLTAALVDAAYAIARPAVAPVVDPGCPPPSQRSTESRGTTISYGGKP